MNAREFVLWVKGVIDTHPEGIDSKATWVSKPQISNGGMSHLILRIIDRIDR